MRAQQVRSQSNAGSLTEAAHEDLLRAAELLHFLVDDFRDHLDAFSDVLLVEMLPVKF